MLVLGESGAATRLIVEAPSRTLAGSLFDTTVTCPSAKCAIFVTT